MIRRTSTYSRIGSFNNRGIHSFNGRNEKSKKSQYIRKILILSGLVGFLIFWFLSPGLDFSGGTAESSILNLKTEGNGFRQKLFSAPEDSTKMEAFQQTLLGIERKTKDRKKGRRLGIFMGIFTTDSLKCRAKRSQQRKLFRVWDDPRICVLHEMQTRSYEQQQQCEFIYAFILAANPSGPTQILAGDSAPLLQERPFANMKGDDLDLPDVVGLGIKENKNTGKSQTFFNYASKIAEEYELDYVVKCDGDAVVQFHEFFAFAYENLITSAGLSMNNVFAGSIRDKAHWPKVERSTKILNRMESYFGNAFEGVHLYIGGQFYLMSTNLAIFVAKEAVRSQCDDCEFKCSYCEGREDHDISAMILHSKEPVHLLIVSKQNQYWEYPIRTSPEWKQIITRETARMDSSHS